MRQGLGGPAVWILSQAIEGTLRQRPGGPTLREPLDEGWPSPCNMDYQSNHRGLDGPAIWIISQIIEATFAQGLGGLAVWILSQAIEGTIRQGPGGSAMCIQSVSHFGSRG